MCVRVSVRKCFWMGFGYVIEFLMLIRQMAFIFHKSKQEEKRATLDKLSNTLNRSEVSFSSYE